jgi:hypothetical protein
LYNIGLIYGSLGKVYSSSRIFYHQALSLNPNLHTSSNNNAVIYHSPNSTCGLEEDEYIELSKELFDKAAEYWIQKLLN